MNNENLNFPISNEIKKYEIDIERILIPTNLQKIRLNSGLPIFVDWKTIPFRSDEVIEWYERIKLSNSFFGSKELDKQNELLLKIIEKEYISNVLIHNYEGNHILDNCNLIFKNNNYLFYDIKKCFYP